MPLQDAVRLRPAFLLAAAVLALASCGVSDGSLTAPSPGPGGATLAKGGGGGKPTADSTFLAMTVVGGGDYQIQSDGLGDYINGVDGMGVAIDEYGNLQISPYNFNGSAPPLRRLDVRYPSGLVYTFPEQWNFKIKSNRANNGNPRIQDMAVGTALCYNVTISHSTELIAYHDNFNPAADVGSSYALVTRTDPTTWTVTSNGVATTGLDCGVDDVAFVNGQDLTVKGSRGGTFTVGLVSQPFSIVLRALP